MRESGFRVLEGDESVGSRPDVTPLSRTVHPLEGPRPCRRRGSNVPGNPGARDDHSKVVSGPYPSRRSSGARTGARREGPLFEVARCALGPRNARRHRLSAWGSSPRPAPGPRARPLARRCVLPRIRCGHEVSGVSEVGRSSRPRPISPLRVATRKRALLPREARDRGWPFGRPRGAPPALAVAGWRLEL